MSVAVVFNLKEENYEQSDYFIWNLFKNITEKVQKSLKFLFNSGHASGSTFLYDSIII